MATTQDQLDRIHAQVKKREAEGYFRRAAAGDQRAASLFARMIAHDVNPKGKSDESGWLSKVPPEANVDGWAEDSICCNANEADLLNVLDLVNGAGAPGANIPPRYAVDDLKPRRPHNKWTKPKALTADELDYLLDGAEPEPLPPQTLPGFPYPDESTFWKAFQDRVKAAYNSVQRPFPDPNDSDAFRRFSRCGYDCRTQEPQAMADKHIQELRQELGAPPE